MDSDTTLVFMLSSCLFLCQVTDMPEIKLRGASLSKVVKFMYLGHWVSEDLSDIVNHKDNLSLDIEQERRA